MRKKLTLLAALVCCVVTASQAQVFQLGLKLEYASTSVEELITSVREEVTQFSTQFLKGCEGGVAVRLNLGRWVTLQPEANFSIGSLWDSVDAQSGFINQAKEAVREIQTVNLAVPVLVGAHLVQVPRAFDMRLFAGPEFYTTIKGASERKMDWDKYSIVAGLGMDFFNHISVDARLARYSDGTTYYRIGMGLFF